jgi:hypothetical protein
MAVAAYSTTSEDWHTSASPTIASLQRELDTDWAPDPWSWRDLVGSAIDQLGPDDVSEEKPAQLAVPFLGGRLRHVPLLGPLTRILLQRSVARSVASTEVNLSPGVLAYRLQPDGTIEHYRSALRNRWRVERALLETHRYVLVTDLRAFFSTVSTSMVERALSELGATRSQDLLILLKEFEGWFGYALPEGYAASRTLANVCLHPLDKSITAPFTRWLDDYRIFVSSRREAQRITSNLAEVANRLGYKLSKAKTRVIPSNEFDANTFSSLGGHAEEGEDIFDEVLAAIEAPHPEVDNERRLRLLLRLCAEQRDTGLLDALAEIGAHHLPGSSLPRLSYALASCPVTTSSSRIFCRLWELDDELTEWRRLRLSYVLWYWPTDFVVSYSKQLVATYKDYQAPRLPLIRVFAKHSPELVSKLAAPGLGLTASRARYMATLESGGNPRLPRQLGEYIRSPQAAIEHGPPIESYL